ncbi:DeoR/GlpR family DNA-binding transcription regulator [Gulosibacter molinativorax]|uniref:Lactose phosphotransferase system repressor n=1 Tax=Gulosibacter molinativorax TaxID=256821 RepID=A0ABT7C9Y8_9MICO|nr:DeoR/GlpR family DNA-binding transcription regulator [Gulosibacter molinativorax]MDJ1371972.1 DeoR/GlpR transcriptional regulator [Gulosibacter molinativorax]QUY62664.1 Transcriptional regulator, DeoR family [Gulosibacter molinativorax]
MSAETRRRHILEELTTAGRVRVATLATQLDVADETVRRDLVALEQEGELVRVHGGAVSALGPRTFEVSLEERIQQGQDAKRAIAERAYELLPEQGGAILLDSGSTTLELARIIAQRAPTARFSIVTNSVAAVSAFSDRADLSVYLIGGTVRAITQSVVPLDASAQLDQIRVDVAFLGTNGCSAGYGFSTPGPDEAAIKRAFIASARQRYVLVDAAKFGAEFTHRFAGLAEVDGIITDAAPDERLARALHDAGTEVLRS